MKSSLLPILFVLPGLAHATTDSALAAKASALLKGADTRLAAATTLKAVYVQVDEYPGEYRDLRQTATLTLAKPGSFRLEIVRARRVKASDPWKDSGNDTLNVSDGHDAYAVFFHPHSTQVRPVDAPATPELKEAPLLTAFFAGARSPSAQFEKANAQGEASDLDVSSSKVHYRAGDVERTIELGPDGLVHQLVVHNDKSGTTQTWTLNSVSLDQPIAASAFHYAAPKDALPFPVAERVSGIRTGGDAPDFEVASASNTPIHLSDFKGKVVVLEFWATWCWPCNQSIPETKRLITTYHDQGVEGLLVAIKDSRKGFDAWLKKHPPFSDLRFAFDDPVHGQAYEAFQHPTNPILYVIGRDGHVLFKTEGYTGPNPAVEQAIKSAL